MTAEPIIQRFPPTSVIDVAKLYGRALCRSLAAAGETDLRGCLVDFVTGRRQLWGIFEQDVAGPLALFRTEIIVEDDGWKTLQVSALAGRDLKQWSRLLSQRMQNVARETGCGTVQFAGRDAWRRVLPEFEPIGVVEGSTIFEMVVKP
jgi:hypothetical protein